VILPSTRLLWGLTVLAALAVAVSIYPDYYVYWSALAGVTAVLAILDAAVAFRLATPPAARQVPGSLALGVPVEVALRVHNPSRLKLLCELHDHHPASLESQGLPRRLALAAAQWGEVRYQARPVARGEASFGRTELRIFSPLQLFQVRRFSGEPSRIRVYPNFRALARSTLLATDNRL
jgi:uncharacterized protein (DUF58 family)